MVNRVRSTTPRVPFEQSLAATHPEIAEWWHGDRNAPLTPLDVRAGSHRLAWWTCAIHHVLFDMEVRHRVRGMGRPECKRDKCSDAQSARSIRKSGTLADAYPDLSAQWDSRNTKRPDDVSPGSKYRAHWCCPDNPDHVWAQAVHVRTGQKTGCPYCARQKLHPADALDVSHPDLAAEWHEEANAPMSVKDVHAGYTKPVVWRCAANSKHVWRASPKQRTRHHTGCPYCAGQQVLPEESLAATRPDLMREWDPDSNDCDPATVPPGSARQVWWRCARNPEHRWRTPVVRRTAAGSGCPYCAGKVITEATSLAVVAPEIAAEWATEPERACATRLGLARHS